MCECVSCAVALAGVPDSSRERVKQMTHRPGLLYVFMERWLVGWLVVQYLVLSLSVQVELLIEVRGAALFVADDAPSVVRRIRGSLGPGSRLKNGFA